MFELCAFQIALAVGRCEFACRELPHALDDRFDQIGLGMCEAFGRGQLFDPGIDADGEQLVGGGRGTGGHLQGVLRVGGKGVRNARTWQAARQSIAREA